MSSGASLELNSNQRKKHMTNPKHPFTATDTYLGDGVYASFDGFQVWLAVNHHENKVVALDPKVLENLGRYAARLNETLTHDEGAA